MSWKQNWIDVCNRAGFIEKDLRSRNPYWRQSFLRRWWLKFAWWFPPTRWWYRKSLKKPMKAIMDEWIPDPRKKK